MKWYVLHVMTGEEKKIKDKLLRDIPGTFALVPKEIIIERHRGIRKEVVKTLFPSYIFVKMKLDDENYYTARGTPDVFNFLGVNRPSSVPESEMINILRWCGDNELIGLSQISIGKDIEVIKGPLKGMEGQIIKIDKRKGRAKVLITLFNEPKEISLGIEVIQALK